MTEQSIKGLDNLPENLVESLIEGGYRTAKAIAIATPADLSEDTGLSEKVSEEIIGKAISNVANPPMTAKEIMEMERKRGKVTTSSNALDALLGGGAWAGEIMELSGGYATGKTQLCFQFAVNAQLPRAEGGFDGKVFFVDSEGTFSSSRVGEMALGHDLDPNEVLENIFVARVLDSQHQTRIVQKINDMAEEENIKLVIIDSIAAHFRTDYVGKEKIPERQQRIMQHASSLTNLAYLHDIAVIVTNQMVAKVDDVSGGAEKAPALGESWSHRPQTRVILRKSPGLARIARLTDTPRRPDGEEVFYITDQGIRDNPRG